MHQMASSPFFGFNIIFRFVLVKHHKKRIALAKIYQLSHALPRHPTSHQKLRVIEPRQVPFAIKVFVMRALTFVLTMLAASEQASLCFRALEFPARDHAQNAQVVAWF